MADKSHALLGEDGELRAQIEGLRRDISAIAGVVGDIAGPAARKRVAAAARELGKETGSALSDAEDYVGETAGAVEDAIRERPVQSALLAFGVGILVAKLFLSKRN